MSTSKSTSAGVKDQRVAKNNPVIALTVGEPAGIGPDITLALAQQSHDAALIAITDPDVLEQRAAKLKLAIRLLEFHSGQECGPLPAGSLYYLPVRCPKPVVAGQLDPGNAAYVLETLRIANDGCLSGDFSAVVTAPVHKGVINDGGHAFSGHTEYFADLSSTPQVVMMLATSGLRVALATTHLPLSQVSGQITRPLLEQVIGILHGTLLQQFGCTQPRILVCGLNPHAGEGGHLGDEEIRVIEPVLAHLRSQGMDLTGPLPADTLFTPKYLDQADAVLAMYHDQGLPVLKYKGFGNAVNVTLGLPYVRTSVDHGTALDLAATGQADAGSLKVAVDYALTMINNRT